MKVLVTGAQGMLGTDLVKILSEKNEVSPFDLPEMDITDYSQVLHFLEDIKPNIVIHLAAFTAVDDCEKEIDKAFLVNALGTQNVATACQKVNIPLLYISTDFVFDGEKNFPYTEFDKPNPISIYGRTKLVGEEMVKSILNKYFIVRTSWLFGKHGSNFIEKILAVSEKKKEIKVVTDQRGSPTYSVDLSYALRDLIETPYFGIYHICNKGNCSRYEFACKILEFAGRNDVRVLPINSEEIADLATRPKYSVLRNYCLELRGMNKMRSWEEALRDYLGGL